MKNFDTQFAKLFTVRRAQCPKCGGDKIFALADCNTGRLACEECHAYSQFYARPAGGYYYQCVDIAAERWAIEQ